MKDVTQRQAKGTFSLFSSLPGEEKGWPFPRGKPMAMWQPSLTRAGLCVTPKRGEEGCCHGGLCEANSSRVKWEIFIPRVRRGAGQRLRAGELGYYGQGEAVVYGQVGPWACPGCLFPGSVSVSPSGWGKSSRVGMGNLGPAVGTALACGKSLWTVCVSHPCPCCSVTPMVWVVFVMLCPSEAGGCLCFSR